jgi:PST family polysaccharide transporter
MDPNQIYERSLSGARWGVVMHFAMRSSGFLASIALARLLTPGDYGLVGMAATVAGIVSIFSDLGLGQAMLQCQEDIEKRAGQTFWVNLTVGLCLTAVQILIAPWVAAFYATPQLSGILVVTSIGYSLSAIGTVSGVLLQKSLDFRKTYSIEAAASVVRIAASIVLALLGFGFWSIIVSDLFSKLTASILKLYCCKWRPGRPSTLDGYRSLLKYGQFVYFTNLLNYGMNNADFIILGKLYGPLTLGPYYFAYNLVMMLHQVLSGLTGNITMPAIAALSSEGDVRQEYLRKTLMIIGISAVPIYWFLVADGRSIVSALYGSKWQSAAIPLTYISAFGAVRGLVSPIGSYSWAAGDARTPFVWHLVAAPLMAISMFVAARHGVNQAAACTGIVYSMFYTSFAVLIARVQHIKLIPLVSSLARPMAVVLAVALLIILLRDLTFRPALLKLVMDAGIYGSLVMAGWYLFAHQAILSLKKAVLRV